MNKKGQFNFTLFNVDLKDLIPWWLILILIILVILILGGIVAYFIIDNLYTQQFNHGKSFLDSFNISIKSNNPAKGDITASILATIEGFDINDTDILIVYSAYNFDKSQSTEIKRYQYNIPFSKTPYHLTPEVINTADIYSKFGNQAKICIAITLTYKNINWFAYLKGYPSKDLNDCTDFVGQLQ